MLAWHLEVLLDELAGDEDYRARDNGHRADCGGRCLCSAASKGMQFANVLHYALNYHPSLGHAYIGCSLSGTEIPHREGHHGLIDG